MGAGERGAGPSALRGRPRTGAASADEVCGGDPYAVLLKVYAHCIDG